MHNGSVLGLTRFSVNDIIFLSEVINLNISDYKYKTELHAHTSPASKCADFCAEDAVRIYAELGYTSIVISNHLSPFMPFYGDKEKAMAHYISDMNAAKKAGKEHGINVITGCEIRFCGSNNDYLLFGIDDDALYDAYDFISKDLEAFSQWYRSDERLIIQAHPFRDGITEVSPTLIDGIESFNMHPGHNSRISLAARHAKLHDFIVTSGTDFHHPGHQGLCATLTKKPITNSDELVSVLKSRDYIFSVSGHIILPYGG